MKILVTSGGTKVKIDRVRHIGNMSHGTFGSKIALEILKLAPFFPKIKKVTFLHAAHSKTPFSKNFNWYSARGLEDLSSLLDLGKTYDSISHLYSELAYADFADYQSNLENLANSHKIIVLAAAVSDYLVANYVDGKIRSSKDLRINLEPAPKLISQIKVNHPKATLVGFKLLVNSRPDELIEAAKDSEIKNDCAFVVANDLRDIVDGNHKVMIVNKKGLMLERSQNELSNTSNGLAKLVAGLTILAGLFPKDFDHYAPFASIIPDFPLGCTSVEKELSKQSGKK